jgi:hypothetical protein
METLYRTSNQNNNHLANKKVSFDLYLVINGTRYNPPIEGCTDSSATNYDSRAQVDNGTCRYSGGGGQSYIYGCTDSAALNYNSNANIDNGSCYYGIGGGEEGEGCTDEEASNYDAEAITDDGSCEYEEVKGCMDVAAINYNEKATEDDGSCEYENEGDILGDFDSDDGD